MDENKKWDEARIIERLKLVISSLGVFPTAKQMRIDHNDLLSAIYRSGKTLSEYCELLGFDVKQKSHRYWYQWDNVESEIKKHFPELLRSGICPSTSAMKDVGIASVVFSSHLYGGLSGIAAKLECELASGYISRDGHFLLSHRELIFDEYLYSLGLEHKPNGFLSKDYKYKYDQKVGNVYFEILGYGNEKTSRAIEYRKRWDKKKIVYNDLGYKLVAIESDFFKAKYSVIEDRLDALFDNLGYSTIRKFDFNIFKIISSFVVITENNILDSLSSIASMLGKCPSANDLVKMKRYDLLNRIRLTGGFKKYRSSLGYSAYRKPDNYYTLEITIAELRELQHKLNRFPKCQDCSSSLSHAVAKYGGFKKLKSTLQSV